MYTAVLNLDEGEVIVAQSAGELSSLSLQGFRLLAIEHHDEMQSYSVQEKDQYGGTMYLTKYEKCVKAHYVMYRGAESALRDMSERLVAAGNEKRDALEKSKDISENFDALSKEVASTKECLEKMTTVATDWKNARDSERAKADRLERDIAKVRSAVGEIRMKEILGG